MQTHRQISQQNTKRDIRWSSWKPADDLSATIPWNKCTTSVCRTDRTETSANQPLSLSIDDAEKNKDWGLSWERIREKNRKKTIWQRRDGIGIELSVVRGWWRWWWCSRVRRRKYTDSFSIDPFWDSRLDLPTRFSGSGSRVLPSQEIIIRQLGRIQ